MKRRTERRMKFAIDCVMLADLFCVAHEMLARMDMGWGTNLGISALFAYICANILRDIPCIIMGKCPVCGDGQMTMRQSNIYAKDADGETHYVGKASYCAYCGEELKIGKGEDEDDE